MSQETVNNNLIENDLQIPIKLGLNGKPLQKRGRKKKIIDENEELEKKKNLEQVVKKKRGRKKKWEVQTTTTILDNTPIYFNDERIDNNEYKSNQQQENIETNNQNYEEKQILFGNLNIKVHSNKESKITENIKEIYKIKNKNNVCRIKLCSDDLDDDNDRGNEEENLEYNSLILNNTICESTTGDTIEHSAAGVKKNNVMRKNKNFKYKLVEKNIKCMKYFKDLDDEGKEILFSSFRCYNCHHTFPNKPFFLPIKYCQELNRYEVKGNFCSPNCVKSYAFNSIIYKKNIYLVAEMYRKLFGMDYKIKPAPPIECLKEYGGHLNINEYRKTFINHDNYSLKLINYKIILDEIIVN